MPVRISGRASVPSGVVLASMASAATSWAISLPIMVRRPGRIADWGTPWVSLAEFMPAITVTRALAVASLASQEARRMARAPMPLLAASDRLLLAGDSPLAYLAPSPPSLLSAGLPWPLWPLMRFLAVICSARPPNRPEIRHRTLS